MLAVINYGNIRKGNFYKIILEGYDWYKILINGAPRYTPKWVFGDIIEEEVEEEH